MNRYRISGIKWIAKAKDIRKIPKVLWLKLPENINIHNAVSEILLQKYGFSNNGFDIKDVTIDTSDFHIDEIIAGMSPTD